MIWITENSGSRVLPRCFVETKWQTFHWHYQLNSRDCLSLSHGHINAYAHALALDRLFEESTLLLWGASFTIFKMMWFKIPGPSTNNHQQLLEIGNALPFYCLFLEFLCFVTRFLMAHVPCASFTLSRSVFGMNDSRLIYMLVFK